MKYSFVLMMVVVFFYIKQQEKPALWQSLFSGKPPLKNGHARW
jgi:hypothetical protein